MQIEAHHTGLTVTDLDRAQGWYADSFGFQLEVGFTLPDGVRGAMLSCEGGARIELFEVPDADQGLHDADPATAMRRRGYGHVALGTDDLAAAFAAAVAAGGTAVWEPRSSPEPGMWMAFVHDPEGNLVELIGRQP